MKSRVFSNLAWKGSPQRDGSQKEERQDFMLTVRSRKVQFPCRRESCFPSGFQAPAGSVDYESEQSEGTVTTITEQNVPLPSFPLPGRQGIHSV